MTITYLKTTYICRCQCGQEFHVLAGNCATQAVRLPHETSTICPACGHTTWLSYSTEFQHVARRRRLGRATDHPKPTMVVQDDLNELEQCIEHYKQELARSTNNLANLQHATVAAIRYWREHWNKAIMPHQFQALIRCLKEQREPE